MASNIIQEGKKAHTKNVVISGLVIGLCSVHIIELITILYTWYVYN